MRSRRHVVACTAVIGLALLAAPAAAGPELAILHRDTQLKGTPTSVTGDLPNLAALGADDTTSSITLRTDQPIAVYQGANFTGPCLTVRGNIARLADVFGNDNISSVQVAWTCEAGPYQVDACRANPCGAGFQCVDLPRPAPSNWEGRACVADGSLPESLTLGKAARQSSTGFGGVASRAVDGRTDGVWPAESITSTNLEAGWLEVDLGSAQEIGVVLLHNRTDCCPERLIGARVELTLEPCDRADRTIVGRSAAVDSTAAMHVRRFEPRVSARYLCVRHDRPQYLSIAEVQAFTAVPAWQIAPLDARSPMTDGPGTGAQNWAYTVVVTAPVKVTQLTWTARVASSQQVEARIWDEAGVVLARGAAVAGTGAIADLASPISASLVPGKTYRVGFRDPQGTSQFPRFVFRPGDGGELEWARTTVGPAVFVTGVVSSRRGEGDRPPLTPNAFAPKMSMTYCPSFECGGP